MHCEAAKKLISRYLDDELSPGDRASLEAHLAQCSRCQAELAGQQQLWSLLTRVEPVQPPDVIAAVEARLSKDRGRASAPAWLRVQRVLYAAAAAALVGLFIWSGVWAGKAQHLPAVGDHDRAVGELLTDTPPGMEVVTMLEEIGQRP